MLHLSLHVKSVRVSHFDESNGNNITVEVTDALGNKIELSFFELPTCATRAIRRAYSDANTKNYELVHLESFAGVA